ncbi:MAG: serine/threonine protein kinase [Deltaproteobacteria bacterium]|nr:serine/threonine protein kinase [Deltaproteobacteria bacterium]MBN2672305.1 serine/threonine protein kinase [Deltaproteobacteria bacterium]
MAGTGSFKDDMTGRMVLGRYLIVRKLATGGMGVVYLARYEGAHGFMKPVVVKIIMPGYASDEQFLGMFVREAKILSSMHNPGIVEVIDFGQQDDFYVMVLEYVDGFQLREWAAYRDSQRKVFSIDVVLEIIIGILEPLHYAHSLKASDGDVRAVIHRDISPSNVMLTTEGRIKLVDFGIARMSNMTGGYKTETGAFKGKLSYSAPERFGNTPLTPQCDIYSVGVVLHELLVGENEFYTGDHASTIAKVLHHQVSSVQGRRPDAPPGLDDVIAKALHKNWEKRYTSAMAFADDLRQMLVQSEQKVKEKIAQLVAEDFTDEMADKLGCESLRLRELAWRNPSNYPDAVYDESDSEETLNLRRHPSAEKTEQMTPTAGAGNRDGDVVASERDVRRDASRSIAILVGGDDERRGTETGSTTQSDVVVRIHPAVIFGAVLIVVIIVMGVVLVVTGVGKSSSRPEQFYLVQGDGARTPTSSATEAERNIGLTDDVTSMHEGRSTDSATSAAADDEPLSEEDQLLVLSSVFQQKQSDVEKCMADDATLLAGIDRILVRFSVRTDGVVEKSTVVPSKLSGSRLAECIESIAMETRFPKLKKPLIFAIPIAVAR